jgi:UDP-N-acetylmuramoylalanine--D-glutamate ligase
LSGFMANKLDSLDHFSSWHSDWTQLSVVVVGLAKTGFSVADTLHELGAKVLVVADSASAEILDIVEVLGIPSVIGKLAEQQTAIEEFKPDLIVVSPGVAPTNALVQSAVEKKIPIWGDLDLAWRLRDRFDVKQEWICVTGTNGKTTVVELTEAMLLASGVRAVACGNIGKPILDCIRDPAEFEVLVVEMSSFQLHYMNSIEPFSAACLNIAEDHLDWHGSFEAYRLSKERIYEGTKVACVYNLEDSATEQMVQVATVHEGARAIGFGLGTPKPSNVGYVDEFLVDRAFLDQRADSALEIASLEDFHGLGVLTPHLLSNIAAATALARSFGVPPAACREALRNFRVSSHRIELVLEHAGVRYINDSKATNAHAASASLSSFESVVWILGGLLKGVDISSLIAKFAKRLRSAVVIGKDRDDILQSFAKLAPEVPVFEISDDDDVMKRAVELASNSAVAGDVVLLAPAAASMDQFASYQDRGTKFSEAVSKLVGSPNG